MLKVIDVSKYKKDIYWENDKYLGYFYIEIDGFWVYQPNKEQGFWSAYSIRRIADKLDSLNKDWELHLKEVLSNG